MNLFKGKTLGVSLPILIAGVASGLGVILIIGLLSGLVFRPNNCISTPEPVTNSSTSTSSSTTSSILSSSTIVTSTTSSRSKLKTKKKNIFYIYLFLDSLSLPSTTSRPIADRTTTPLFDFRLIDVLRPSKYDLLLKFYTRPYDSFSKESRNYNGEVSIFFQINRPTSRFEIHVDIELVVQNKDIKLVNSDTNQELKISRSGYLPNQLYEIVTEQELNEANYNLVIKFSGRTKSAGLYQANYLEDNLPRELIATNFLPTNARTVL